MSRLVAKLVKLQRDLVNAKDPNEREIIEDEIAELEDQIEEENAAKYRYDDDE